MQVEFKSNIFKSSVRRESLYRRVVKRPMDIILSLTAMLVLSPIILIVAVLVRVKQGAPVLIRQKRPGLHGKIFTIYKFRTMTDEKDETGQLLPDSLRLTNFGKALRATSLDELPELYNVFKGDMSMVGPRPLLPQYLSRYTPEQSRRHDVKPGITGWAQVKGRNALNWQDRFHLDIWYIDNSSMWLDIKILLLTVYKIIKREGISQPGQVTCQEFMGKDEK